MKKLSTIIALLLLSALLSGCLHLEQSLKIFDDGSAAVVLHYFFPEEQLDVLADSRSIISDWQRSGGSPGNWVSNPKKAARFFEDDNIDLVDCHTYTKDGLHHIIVQCRMADVQKGLDTGKFGSFELRRMADGNIRLRAGFLEPARRPDAAAGREIDDLLANVKIKLSVSVPGRVMQTTADKTSDSEMEWDLSPDAGGAAKKVQVVFRSKDFPLASD